MQLTRLVYASKHDDTSAETLDRILQTSRRNNVRDNITGALIIGDQTFMQLLEGDRDSVGRCLMRVMQDNRHRDIRIVCSGDVKGRLFGEWHMHQIKTSRVKREILSRYTIDGAFQPSRMTQMAIEDMCRTLSAGNWEAMAA